MIIVVVVAGSVWPKSEEHIVSIVIILILIVISIMTIVIVIAGSVWPESEAHFISAVEAPLSLHQYHCVPEAGDQAWTRRGKMW